MPRIVWHVTVSGTWRSIMAAICWHELVLKLSQLYWRRGVVFLVLMWLKECGVHCRQLYFLIIFCFLPLYKSYVYFLLWFQDTGKLNVSYFRFDINDATGDLDANRPVPFRLTPNISEFLTTIGVSGPLTASMIAVARCFAQPNFKVPRLLSFFLFKYTT